MKSGGQVFDGDTTFPLYSFWLWPIWPTICYSFRVKTTSQKIFIFFTILSFRNHIDIFLKMCLPNSWRSKTSRRVKNVEVKFFNEYNTIALAYPTIPNRKKKPDNTNIYIMSVVCIKMWQLCDASTFFFSYFYRFVEKHDWYVIYLLTI